jgi:hypothetical protein
MCGVDLKMAELDVLSNPTNIEFINIKTAIPINTPSTATVVNRLLDVVYVKAISLFIK